MDGAVRDDQVERWLDRLEKLIPEYVNGMSDQGELVVELRYIPNSLRLEHFVKPDEEDQLTLCYITITYLVEKREIEGMTFAPLLNLWGALDIPVDHGFNLVLDDVNFRDGLIVRES